MLQRTTAGFSPIQSRGGGPESAPPPPKKRFFIITLEQFRSQSLNYTTFPKILLAIVLSVFQHYPRSPVAMVTNNLEDTFLIFECFLLC